MDPATYQEILRYGEYVCGSLNCETVQKRALPEFVRLTGADMAGICLLDSRDRLTVVSAMSVPATIVHEFGAIAAPMTCPLFQQANAVRFPVHDTMLSAAKPYHETPHGAVLIRNGFEHALTAPLHHHGRVIGVVTVARRIGQPAFSMREARIADPLARFASIALANATAYEAATTARHDESVRAHRDGSVPVETIRFSQAQRAAARVVHGGVAAEVRETLSARELEVFELLATGLTNAEIGHELGIALNTVKQHVRRIYDKLGARSRVDAVRLIVSPAA